MKNQRIEEWIENFNPDYFDRQFKTTYRSTVKFCDWLEELGILSKHSKDCNILDIATGKGANLFYFQQRFPHCDFLGMDINKAFVNEGKAFFEKENIGNCKLVYDDLYKMNIVKNNNIFNGITCLQTLSWLPGYQTALDSISNLQADWMAFSSLFYDGLVDCAIEISEFLSEEDKISSNTTFYNIYSLPRFKNYLSEKGYTRFEYIPFEIDIDLPKPSHTRMQTYTQLTSEGSRLQRSGPLLMPWYFIFVAKK